MFGLTLLDVCAYLGQAAVGAIALNLLLGGLISLRYSPVRYWPHRHVNVFALHRWTAYVALVLMVSHPAVLLLVKAPHFGLFDVLAPVHSPLQPVVNTLGAAALYLILLVVVTSLLRHRMSRRVWRNLHFLVYPAAVLLMIHSILADPELKTGYPDFLDGGKVYLYGVAAALAVAVGMRWKMRGRGLRPAARKVVEEAEQEVSV